MQEIYRAEFAYVWNSLRRLGVRHGDLPDLTHDVFVTAWRQRNEFDRSRPVRPWLFGIAFRVAVGNKRRAASTREVLEQPPESADLALGPEEHATRNQDRRLVLQALQMLELDRRAVFIMFELHGHSMPEISQALSLPLNTAYSRLRLARADFANAIRTLQAKGGER